MVRSVDAVLDRAAELIEERGWCQAVSSTADCRICASYAITIAAKGSITYPTDAHHFFADYIGGRPIPEWNDQPQMSKERVVAALRAAARSARSDE